MSIEIFDEVSSNVRVYEGNLEKAVARYIDEVESEAGSFSNNFALVARVSGGNWMRYHVATAVVRNVTVGRGSPCDAPEIDGCDE